jgi:hypothetical protein
MTVRKARRRRSERSVYIYQLLEPGSSDIRYVGQSVNPYGRVFQHQSSICPEVRAWMYDLNRRGLWPDVLIVGLCKKGEEFADEKAATLLAVAQGANLLNKTWVKPVRRREKILTEKIMVSLPKGCRAALRSLVEKHALSSEVAAVRFLIVRQLRLDGLLTDE